MNFKNRSGRLGGRPFTEEEPIDQELTIKMPKSMKETPGRRRGRRKARRLSTTVPDFHTDGNDDEGVNFRKLTRTRK